jgi:hypothetical protein
VAASVLLSIKPEFVEKIFSGLKKYEFRRVIFKSKSVSRVVIYASSPVQRVVGEFAVGGDPFRETTFVAQNKAPRGD